MKTLRQSQTPGSALAISCQNKPINEKNQTIPDLLFMSLFVVHAHPSSTYNRSLMHH